MAKTFANPFRPGAGHMPPYLAGRELEIQEFERLLKQDVILENLILTGLRGVGKTVLLDTLKPIAIKAGWLWVGTEFHEAASIAEERIATRLLSDLAVVTSNMTIQTGERHVGFAEIQVSNRLDHKLLDATRRGTPGMVVDGLKRVLELVWSCIQQLNFKGVIFAYDEAQNLADHAARNEYPLSTMLDCFQSIQKKNIPMMLVLAGLPTLFPKLVESRTFAERMFHIQKLDRLPEQAAREAIIKPIESQKCPVKLQVEPIVDASGGYPYFIQFICKEAYDSYLQQVEAGIVSPNVFIEDVIRKLDTDFFAGRWAKATDRQRELMYAIARTEHAGSEFTVREVADATKKYLERPISPSQVSQMFNKLGELSLTYKNRAGKYSFAVPLMHEFIKRQSEWFDEEIPQMTIAACYVSKEGVVLGADSTTTYWINNAPRHYHNAQKIFEIGELGSTLGAVTWGMGAFPQKSYRQLAAELSDDLIANEPASMLETATRWSGLVWHEYETQLNTERQRFQALAAIQQRSQQEQAEYAQLVQSLTVGFCIGGHVRRDRTPMAFEMLLTPSANAPVQVAPIDRNRPRFWGMPNMMDRLLTGIDQNLFGAIIQSGRWNGTPQDLGNLVTAFALNVQVELPLREAIDWIFSSIFFTIKALKFSSLPPFCGGPIEVAVLSADRRFRWISHKGLDQALSDHAPRGKY